MREKRRLKLITPLGKCLREGASSLYTQPKWSREARPVSGLWVLWIWYQLQPSWASAYPHAPLPLRCFLCRPSNKGKVLCGTTGRTQSRHRPPYGLPAWPEQGAPAGPHTCSTYGPSFPTWPQPEQGQPMSAFSVCCYCCNVFINP